MASVPARQLTTDWSSVIRPLTGEPASPEMEAAAIDAISRDIERQNLDEADLEADVKRSRCPVGGGTVGQ